MVTKSELLAKFIKACTISTFLSTQQAVCDAWKLPVDIRDLAVFKYLLPDEIRFEFEDRPTDTVFNGVPDLVLLFEFADKRARLRKTDSIRQVISGRVERLERAIEQYMSRRGSLEKLHKSAVSCIPPEALAIIANAEEKQHMTPTEFEINVKQEDESLQKVDQEDGAGNWKNIFDELCENLDNIIAKTVLPSRKAKHKVCPPSVSEYTGREELWSHQAEAIDYLESNNSHNLVISTATASGKSLIFHSLVKKMLDHSDGTAMLIYPTKALAQDQYRSFSSISSHIFTFDGDTPYATRKAAKQNARVLLVNPDILSSTILPGWKDWAQFLGNLKYVVIDELHYYHGIFGAHVACVMRRMRRLCFQLGADSCQFIGCSATISDPRNLLVTLTGVSEETVMSLSPENDGSPAGSKTFVFCTPNYLTPEDPTTGRMHPIKVAAPLLVNMVRGGLRVIVFCRFRKECELMLKAVYEIDTSLSSTVKAYRGGYSPEDRRQIESLMFTNKLRGIVSTSALEVGIDIGGLDAAIICGFPHSLASFRQQVGRVGRRQRDSLVVYVADGSVVDQNYAANPDRVLFAPIEQTPIILHDSIVRSHIQAAAHELAMEPEDFSFFPQCDNLKAAGLISLDDIETEAAEDENSDLEIIDVQSRSQAEPSMNQVKDSEISVTGHLQTAQHKCPTKTMIFPYKPKINIRRADDELEDTAVIDVDTNTVIEHVERERVGFSIYDGAIFVHQGKAYLVTHLDADLKYAKVRKTNVTWMTRQRDYTDVDPWVNEDSRPLALAGAMGVSRGQIKITTRVFGYYKFDKNNQIIESVDVQIPDLITYKSGVYLNIPYVTLEALRSRKHHVAASIHAAEHAVISAMPLFMSMSPGDIGTECKAPEKELMKKQMSLRRRPARLIFYEKHGGKLGNGILRSSFPLLEVVLETACKNLDNCPCEKGCGSCIGSGQCVEHNSVLSKNGAKVILYQILGKSLEGIPLGPDLDLLEQLHETVVSVDAHT